MCGQYILDIVRSRLAQEIKSATHWVLFRNAPQKYSTPGRKKSIFPKQEEKGSVLDLILIHYSQRCVLTRFSPFPKITSPSCLPHISVRSFLLGQRILYLFSPFGLPLKIYRNIIAPLWDPASSWMSFDVTQTLHELLYTFFLHFCMVLYF